MTKIRCSKKSPKCAITEDNYIHANPMTRNIYFCFEADPEYDLACTREKNHGGPHIACMYPRKEFAYNARKHNLLIWGGQCRIKLE